MGGGRGRVPARGLRILVASALERPLLRRQWADPAVTRVAPPAHAACGSVSPPAPSPSSGEDCLSAVRGEVGSAFQNLLRAGYSSHGILSPRTSSSSSSSSSFNFPPQAQCRPPGLQGACATHLRHGPAQMGTGGPHREGPVGCSLSPLAQLSLRDASGTPWHAWGVPLAARHFSAATGGRGDGPGTGDDGREGLIRGGSQGRAEEASGSVVEASGAVLEGPGEVAFALTKTGFEDITEEELLGKVSDEFFAELDVDDDELESLILMKDVRGLPRLPPLEELLHDPTGEEEEAAQRRGQEKAKQEEQRRQRVRVVDELGRSYATGRRKASVARVWLAEGSGNFSVNGRLLDLYFSSIQHRTLILQPLIATGALGDLDIMATVKGGGLSGQAGALRLGISRALQLYEPEMRPTLKAEGLLTRDSRVVERKKPGKAKARKSFQWVKR